MVPGLREVRLTSLGQVLVISLDAPDGETARTLGRLCRAGAPRARQGLAEGQFKPGWPIFCVAARRGATATFISTGPLSGLVLVAGGENQSGTALSSAELYNPATGTFESTGSMTTARAFHTATLMTDGPLAGDVLIAGGIDNKGDVLSSAEILDPLTSQFWAVGGMFYPRKYHVAVPFNFTCGGCTSATTYVLVAGGETSTGALLNKVEIFDPATETFNSGGTMKSARKFFTATALASPPSASTERHR